MSNLALYFSANLCFSLIAYIWLNCCFGVCPASFSSFEVLLNQCALFFFKKKKKNFEFIFQIGFFYYHFLEKNRNMLCVIKISNDGVAESYLYYIYIKHQFPRFPQLSCVTLLLPTLYVKKR